jgi:hypothetical protein
MVNENDNDDFGKTPTIIGDALIASPTPLYTNNYFKNETEYSKITANESTNLSKSCYYNKLSSIDFILKNMHKKWSIID